MDLVNRKIFSTIAWIKTILLVLVYVLFNAFLANFEMAKVLAVMLYLKGGTAGGLC